MLAVRNLILRVLRDSIWQFLGVLLTLVFGILGLLYSIFTLADPARLIFSAIGIVLIACSLVGIVIVLALTVGTALSWKIKVPVALAVVLAVSIAILIVRPVLSAQNNQSPRIVATTIHPNLIYDDSMHGPHPDNGTWDQTKESGLNTAGAGNCTFEMDGYHISAVDHYRECKAKITNLTGNFKIEARVTILAQGSTGGFLLRRQDGTETGYLVEVGATGQCQVLRDPGTVSLTSSCHTTAENSYLLDVTMSGKQITVEIDNNLVANITDTTYANGIIGLYVSGSDSSLLKTEVVFTDVKVWNI